MILREKIFIHASPERVWEFLEELNHLKTWNQNISALVPLSAGRLCEGSAYRARRSIAGKEGNFLVEILECRKPERMVGHLSGGNFSRRGYALEVFELAEVRDATLLTQVIEIHKAGINPFGSLLARFRHRFGEKAAGKSLMRLKRMAESPAA